MKKTYSTPLTEVVKINAEQLICQSLEVLVGDPVPEGLGGGESILGKEDEEFDENFW